ncbi:hypothetical protein JOS77_23995 [Chromobacterium haemolyticum]|nr:hypothetical protein JOS77_23995 [Chromobacterium haemolyticum]
MEQVFRQAQVDRGGHGVAEDAFVQPHEAQPRRDAGSGQQRAQQVALGVAMAAPQGQRAFRRDGFKLAGEAEAHMAAHEVVQGAAVVVVVVWGGVALHLAQGFAQAQPGARRWADGVWLVAWVHGMLYRPRLAILNILGRGLSMHSLMTPGRKSRQPGREAGGERSAPIESVHNLLRFVRRDTVSAASKCSCTT